MGALFDLLKDIPLSSVLKEKIATFENENASLKTEIAILKDDLREAQAENKRLKQEIDKLTHKDDIHEIERKLLIVLADGREFAVDIAAELKLPLIRVQYHLQELVTNDYVEDRLGHPLTQKGRKYLIDNNLI